MGVAWAAIFRTDVTVFVVGADAIAAACSAVGNTTVAIFIVPANTISTFFFTWFFFAFFRVIGVGFFLTSTIILAGVFGQFHARLTPGEFAANGVFIANTITANGVFTARSEMIAAAVCFTTAFVGAFVASKFGTGSIPLNIAAPEIQCTDAFDAFRFPTASAAKLDFATISITLDRAETGGVALCSGQFCTILSPGASATIIFQITDTLLATFIYTAGTWVGSTASPGGSIAATTEGTDSGGELTAFVVPGPIAAFGHIVAHTVFTDGLWASRAGFA